MRMRLVGLVAIPMSVVILVSGCGTGGTPGATEPLVLQSEPGITVSESAADFQYSDKFAGASENAMDFAPAIIVSGTASIETSDPAQSAAEFEAYILDLGGRIEYSSTSEYDSSPFASVGARVPSEKFSEAISGLDQFGRVQNTSVNNQDVGQWVADSEARIKVLKESISRLQELMDQATTVEELIAAETGLTERQAELDSWQSQLDWLTNQVDMSSLNVDFATAATSADGFSFEKAWRNFLQSVVLVGYWLLILLPWAALIGIVFLGVRALVRKVGSKGKKPKPAGADTAVPSEVTDSDVEKGQIPDPPRSGI